MAEGKTIGRKSQMFLHSVIPVINTHDELIRQKFKRGKFTFTITGVIKVIGNVLLLLSILLFVTNSKCEEPPAWFPYLLPCCLGVNLFITLILYIIFSLGFTTSNPGKWVYTDIAINAILAIATIVVCIFTTTNDCVGVSTLQHVPMILGLCAGGVLIVGCAALFLLYRYREEEELDDDRSQHNRQQPLDSRKSIFA